MGGKYLKIGAENLALEWVCMKNAPRLAKL